jgi:ABC-type dipeptide/oligopeptide/nickel transport system permease component
MSDGHPAFPLFEMSDEDEMSRIILARIVQAPITLFGVLTIVFFMLTAAGDPSVMLVSPDATPDMVEAMRQKMGFDRPVYEQYFAFMTSAIQGDFGQSFREREPAFQVVMRYFPATLELAFVSVVLSTLVSIPIGVLSAWYRGGWIDRISAGFSVLGQSMPTFWIGIVFILCFSLKLGWTPVGGRGSFLNLILPSLVLAWHFSAVLTRLVRSALLEVLNENYIRTARAKGAPEWIVVWKHACRNIQASVLTVWGLQLGALITGAVVTETVFSWPGIGRATIAAVQGRDYPVVLAAVFSFTVLFLVINLVTDILYRVLDPRIRDQ